MKNLTKRIGAIALAACIVMSMALTASAASYKLTLTFKGVEEDKTVTATSGWLGDSDSLAAAVYQMVGSKTTADQKTLHKAHAQNPAACSASCGLYQLWSKELDDLFDVGKDKYNDGEAAWQEWVGKFTGADGDDELVTWLSDFDTQVGPTLGSNAGKGYSMTYTAASGKVYVLTVSATRSGGGSVSGGGTTPAPTPGDGTVTNPDGSTTTTKTDKVTGTVTETTKNTDGSTTVTETKKDGTVTETVKETNGVTATTTTDIYGKGETTVTIPDTAASDDEAVTLPVEGKTQFTVNTTSDVKVEIPVEDVTPGTVAIIVKADGTEEVIQNSVMTEDGIVVTLEDGATLKVVDNAKDFTDMDDHWAENAVDYVTARNMFSGTGNGSTFSPETQMTRAMLAQVLYNLEGAVDHDHDHGFTDIDDGAWYSKAVNWAAKNSVVSGYGDGSYQPDKLLTREEVAQIFFNYAKSKGYDMSHSAELDHFVDDHEVSDWALNAKKWAVGAGLISGKGGNVLGAKHNATRAEGAQMFMNFCQNIAE